MEDDPFRASIRDLLDPNGATIMSSMATGRALFPLLPIALLLSALDPSKLSAATTEDLTDSSVLKEGFLFLDGRYLDAPYVIERVDNTYTINGQEFRTEALTKGKADQAISVEQLLQTIYWQLASTRIGQVVVLYQNQEPMVLDSSREGWQLLRILARGNNLPKPDQEIPETLRSELERETWARVVSDFEPSGEFLPRANEFVAETIQLQREAALINRQNVWAGRLEYPLTVFAMVVVTLAFGHLVSTKPYVAADAAFMVNPSLPTQTVLRSLLIVGILSVVDLLWTVLASEAGSMRELNPLGSQWLDRPIQLAAFKSATISPAIGLLYWLRRAPIAQAASWWSCLVITLVTARWLTFNSMFL